MESRQQIRRRDWLGRAALCIGCVGLPSLVSCSRTNRTSRIEAPAEASESFGTTTKAKGLRLTLRVLLAYRDGVLDHQDQADITKKLRSSAFATELNDRIDQISAENVDHRAIEQGDPLPDPNRVAEYLDNVLARDDVVNYERLCLENDAPLAEVAVCHNLLVEFLESPREIEAELQSRIKDAVKQALTDLDDARSRDVC